MQGNGINLCDLALNFDENPKGRKAAVFQLNFQRDIKPLLFLMGKNDFKGKSMRNAAMEIRDYVAKNCDCLFWLKD